MGAKEETQGLDPCEVAGSPDWSEADEPGIDLEAGVGYQRIVLVAPAMEIEDNVVPTDETGVVACGPHPAAIRLALWSRETC